MEAADSCRLNEPSHVLENSGFQSNSNFSHVLNESLSGSQSFSVERKLSNHMLFSQFFELYQKVTESGLYNYEGCRIPLKTNLNVPFFRFMLSDYQDREVCEFLDYGFPIGVTGKVQNKVSKVKNHRGVTAFPLEVKRYLEKEIGYGAVIGPLDHIPFSKEWCISPLNTVPKRDSSDRRVILDLSFPEQGSINEHIPKSTYLATRINLTFPRVDDLVEIIKKKKREKLSFVQA